MSVLKNDLIYVNCTAGKYIRPQVLNVIFALVNGCTMIKIEQNIILSQAAHTVLTFLHGNKLLSGEQIEEPEQRLKNSFKDTSQYKPQINNNYRIEKNL